MNEIDLETNEQTSNEDSKNWLQRLKDESWEAELLISAVAIFGTLKLFSIVDWVVNLFIDLLPPSQYLIGYSIVFGGLLAISILTTMFVIHFSLRAYWVGLVGLNSVFPDYGLEDSVYSEIFTKKILSVLPKLKKTVHQVDELCSVIFSAAFFMLILYLYLTLFACLYLSLYNLLSDYLNHYILLIPLFLMMFIMALTILMGVVANLERYKQNRTVQLWYFQISNWGSMIALGPMYKNLMQISMTFASNFRKKKSLIELIIVFIVVGFVLTMIEFKNSKIPYLINQEYFFDATKVYHGYYGSESDEEDFLLTPQIESDVMDIGVMQLFIPVYSYELQQVKSVCGEYIKDETKTRKERNREKRAWYLNCYSAYNQVFLNGEKVVTDFKKYNKPKTNQFGLINYVNLENAKKGKNTLKIIKDIGDQSKEWTIPFQYVSD
ncbi:MAG: hypothetical protein NXI23_03065 [Bacteroidetes bacterium]|jgi:hypothetical protein|nr:hypothetical protein [Bacteroidota bacterium]